MVDGTRSPEQTNRTLEPAPATSLARQADQATLEVTPGASISGRARAPGNERLPARFGDYELLRELARGGMGVVYQARQTRLNRLVALKMILAGPNASQTDIDRFFAEAEAAAKLDHPGIVPIFEIGCQDGQNFYSMAFIEGESLAARLSQGPLPPLDAASLMKRIAEAIAYAHRQGVVHRDLKPANVMLDREGEPRVTDFGLAKNLAKDSNLTASGSVMGTPSFMPPEQASGGTAEAGPLADVYSLGAMLYCLVTGRPPFQAATPVETLRQVLVRDPVPPRRLNSQIPKDLENICLKCLEKSPDRRYGSASDLAQDLGRYLRHEPIRARAPSLVGRAWRWCKRNKLSAFFMSAFALSLLYPMIVGLAVMVSFVVNYWSLFRTPPGGLGYTVGFVKDGILHNPGTQVDREAEAEEALSWGNIKAVVVRLRAGRSDDTHFQEGGVLKVWLEVENADGKRTLAEELFDMRCESDVARSKLGRFVLLCEESADSASEYWAVCRKLETKLRTQDESLHLKSAVASLDSRQTADTSQGAFSRSGLGTIPLPKGPSDQELLAELEDRTDLPAEEKELLAKKLRERIAEDSKIKFSGGRSDHATGNSGTIVSTTETLLYQRTSSSSGMERLRRQLDLPAREEKPELEVRIFCRMLTAEEIETAKTAGKLKPQSILP